MIASYYSSNFPTQKQSNYGFLKSNPITASTSGITGTSRSSARREGNVKVNDDFETILMIH